MPRKIRERIADLKAAGFENRGVVKEVIAILLDPKVLKPLTVSGKPGNDAKKYQERAVQKVNRGIES